VKAAGTRAVHQLLATLSPGDAIGNETLAIQAHLRALGFDSEIYCEGVHPRVADRVRPLWEFARVSAPEAICIFHFSIGSAASPLIFHAPDRLVLIYHNITPPEWFVGYHRLLTQLCHRGRRELAAFAPRTTLALGDSEFNRRELEAAGFERTAVLPIVQDLSTLAGPRSPVVQRLYGDDRLNVLFVGRIIPNKKIDDLIRVFAVLQRHIEPRSRLLLVGDHRGHERYYDRLREMVRDLGLEEVVFTGHVDQDELRAYYQVADVFLCLSEHEGYCVPLVEAMHLGLPVIAYDAGAVAETLRGGGVLLREKPLDVVAELVSSVVRDGSFRGAVLATQELAMQRVRAIDFGALVRERLAPVLEAAP
jgi:glycosyltransferase involved in cell wall biosynthesis